MSICMITYNRAVFLSEAIESAQKQSLTDWELIIVDYDSKDNTKEVVEKYISEDSRIKFYSSGEYTTVGISRNFSLARACGKYVAVLDSDDVWCDPQKLQLQYDFLESHPDHALIGGGVVIINKDSKEQKRYMNPLSDAEIRQQMFLRNPFAHSSVMYKRELALKIGGYEMSVAEDYDLFLRFGCVAKFANLEKYVLNYRVHDSNVTVTDKIKTLAIVVPLIKKYKGKYPFYYRAIVWRVAKLWAYRLFLKFRLKKLQ